MSYDKSYVISQLERIIDTAPIYVEVYRTEVTDDGYGGKIRLPGPESALFSMKCVFDNASSPSLVTSASLAGRVLTESSLRLWALYDENEPRVGDIIKVIGQKQSYRVTEVTNILMQNLLFEVKLELRD